MDKKTKFNHCHAMNELSDCSSLKKLANKKFALVTLQTKIKEYFIKKNSKRQKKVT